MAAKKEKKYVVAKGYSFTSGGYIYSEGEEIPEAAFPNKNVFADCVAKGKVVEASLEVANETSAASDEDKKAVLEVAKKELKKALAAEKEALEAAKEAAEKASKEDATEEDKAKAEELQRAAEDAVKAREEAETVVKNLE